VDIKEEAVAKGKGVLPVALSFECVTLLYNNPLLCHPDRSEAEGRDLQSFPLSEFLRGNPLQEPSPGFLVNPVALLQIFQDAFEVCVPVQPAPRRIF
jgi:hypothetical protein